MKKGLIIFILFFLLLLGCATHTETSTITITPTIEMSTITSTMTSTITATQTLTNNVTVTSTVIAEQYPEAIKYGIDNNGQAWFNFKRLIGGRDQIPIFNKNPEAKPASYKELNQFLSSTRQHRTDLLADVKNDCADYCAELFNEAEQAGIESGIVILFSVNDEPNHLLNCFKTVDEGKVYIDSIWYRDNEKNPQIGEYYIVGDGDGNNPLKILVIGIYEIW